MCSKASSKCEFYESDDDNGTPMAPYLEELRGNKSKADASGSSCDGGDAIELGRCENDIIHGVRHLVAESKDSAGCRVGSSGGIVENNTTVEGRDGPDPLIPSTSPRPSADTGVESKCGGHLAAVHKNSNSISSGGRARGEEITIAPLPKLSDEERAGMALALIFGDDYFPMSAAWAILQRTMLFYDSASGHDVMQRLIGDGRVVIQQQVAPSNQVDHQARPPPASFRVATETLVEAVALVPLVVRPATRRVRHKATHTRARCTAPRDLTVGDHM